MPAPHPPKCISWTRIGRRIHLFIIVVAGLGLTTAHAQTAALTGFVTDAADGQPLQGATVALRDPASPDGAPLYGAAANADGLYLIRGIAPGAYAITISFVGYDNVRDTIDLAADERATLDAELVASEELLEEVLVQAEREHGMARVTAGQQRITPEDVELVPSPDVSADLANYLTTLPGVVTSGDRGGQVYVRGGEPSQNLVLLDGMVLYQPFHVLGFYSAFPSDIISTVDLYAGGFPARYSGRMSSVLDVSSRYGNSRRLSGMVSASPFVGSLRLEGPIVPGHASFLFSARESLLEKGAGPMLGEDLPFHFGDMFAKVYLPASRTSRIAVSGLRTHDRSRVRQGGDPSDAIRWSNEGVGLRWMFVPSILPAVMNLHVSRSRHHTELGLHDTPLRASTISHTRVAASATFDDDRATWEGGWDVHLADVRNDLDGIFQLAESSGTSFTEFGFYLQSILDLGPGFSLAPGARLQWYNIGIDPFFEPRLRATLDRGAHHFSAAAGIYNQEVVGITDRRDVANTFTIWSIVPRQEDDEAHPLAGRLAKAAHTMIGYRGTPLSWLEISVEAFYKRMANLYAAEWTAFPTLTTGLQPASGRTFGLEARLEFRRQPFYAFINYGLSSTRYRTKYEAIEHWLGTESFEFRPPHDRRHQLNALASTSWLGLDVSVRWTFGSGLPFTRPLGFDSFAFLDQAGTLTEMMRTRRVLFDRPYGDVLPTYHRLDVSVEHTFRLAAADVTLQGSVLNAYDRRNLFYLDVFTMERQDQLPMIPSIGIRVSFE